jgi:hypothetical protein
MKKNNITQEQQTTLFDILKKRFNQHMQRHPELKWENVQQRLENNQDKLWSLNEMEETDGEPDVIGYNAQTGEYIFCDCSPESPKGRRSLCYDEAALQSRKEHKPKGSALGMAKEMGIEVLNEEQYINLLRLGVFDQKTSSWIIAPKEVRERGGGLFGDSRYGRTFIYHNGAESYYAARGFRGILKV